MKKIVLVDDNSKNQREVYGASFVDDNLYSEYLFHIEQLNVQSDLSFLDDALCVMVHKSLEDYIDGRFREDCHRAEDRIEEIVENKKIPYVLFSDGHGMTADWREEKPNVVYSIKKTEFYLHLEDFIKHYIESGKIDLRIIAYGKDFMKHLMCKWGHCLIACLSGAMDNDLVSVSSFSEKERRALRLIIENSQPKIGVSFNDLMCEIEDEEVTAKRLRSNINAIISNVKKYGKNISTWK